MKYIRISITETSRLRQKKKMRNYYIVPSV